MTLPGQLRVRVHESGLVEVAEYREWDSWCVRRESLEGVQFRPVELDIYEQGEGKGEA